MLFSIQAELKSVELMCVCVFFCRLVYRVHEIRYGWRLKRECQQNWCVSYTHLKCINRFLLLWLFFSLHIHSPLYVLLLFFFNAIYMLLYPLLTDTIFFLVRVLYSTSKRIYIRLIHLSIEHRQHTKNITFARHSMAQTHSHIHLYGPDRPTYNESTWKIETLSVSSSQSQLIVSLYIPFYA